jgi:hypothetical protein
MLHDLPPSGRLKRSKARMNRRLPMKLFTVTMLLGVSTMMSNAAFADRTVWVHGTACQVSSGFAGSFSYSNYGIQNDGASQITVECPLPLSTDPTAINFLQSAYITVYDRSTTANVSCSLQRSDTNGDVSFSTSVNTTGCGPGTGPQTLQFTIASYPPVYADYGYWRVQCTIPGVESNWHSHVTTIKFTMIE